MSELILSDKIPIKVRKIKENFATKVQEVFLFFTFFHRDTNIEQILKMSEENSADGDEFIVEKIEDKRIKNGKVNIVWSSGILC